MEDGKYIIEILLQCTVGNAKFNNSALIYFQISVNLQSFLIFTDDPLELCQNSPGVWESRGELIKPECPWVDHCHS